MQEEDDDGKTETSEREHVQATLQKHHLRRELGIFKIPQDLVYVLASSRHMSNPGACTGFGTLVTEAVNS